MDAVGMDTQIDSYTLLIPRVKILAKDHQVCALKHRLQMQECAVDTSKYICSMSVFKCQDCFLAASEGWHVERKNSRS